MKDIEKLFKDSLENHELPYDASAWNSLESKLPQTNAAQPINFTKWGLIGFAAAVLTISVFIVSSTEEKKENVTTKKQSSQTSIPTLKKEVKNENETNQTTSNKIEKPSNESNKLDSKSNSINPNTLSEIFAQKISIEKSNSTTTQTENNTQIVHNQTLTNNFTSSNNNTNSTIPLKTPNFITKCQGETIEWENSNNKTIVLKSPSGNLNPIRSKEELKITLNQVGNYTFNSVDENGNLNEIKSFKVVSSPVVSLNFDNELVYENGLPIIKVSLDSDESKSKWTLNGKTFDNQGKNAIIHAFNKGTYELVVTVINDEGCKTIESKTINVKDDYNLLAVNSFNPNSLDIRNTTFLPFALLNRTSHFKMVIIDPNDSGIVFETSDASQPWDGIDKRDGKLVLSNKVFIWKVTLNSPEKGEKSEYKGTIIKI